MEYDLLQGEIDMIKAKNKKQAKLKGVVLKPWQKGTLKIFEQTPEDRLIHIISDETGNTGKAFLKKYMVQHYGHNVFSFTPAAEQDILHIAASLYPTNEGPKIIIVDVPRKHQVSEDLLSLCELLKDGPFTTGKYKGHQVEWDEPPHIILFTNSSLQRIKAIAVRALSRDRIKIGKIRRDNNITWHQVTAPKVEKLTNVAKVWGEAEEKDEEKQHEYQSQDSWRKIDIP